MGRYPRSGQTHSIHSGIGQSPTKTRNPRGATRGFLVVLSEGDSEKLSLVLDYLAVAEALPNQTEELAEAESATPDYELKASICQAQRRLTPVEVESVVTRFQAGESMAMLARDYGCDRRTVSKHLRDAGLAGRETSFDPATVDTMVALYASGLSLAAVGHRVGASSGTVRKHLQDRGVVLRDTHGRVR